MNLHQWRRTVAASWSWGVRRGPAAGARRRRRPIVEPMESRQLLSTIAEFPIPTASSGPVGITAGPDGNLWFTEARASKIGRITTSGGFAEFPVPTASSEPDGITAGPDGNLWFTEFAGNNIGRITPGPIVSFSEFLIPTASSDPRRITAGPKPQDGLWFTEKIGNNVGRIKT